MRYGGRVLIVLVSIGVLAACSDASEPQPLARGSASASPAAVEMADLYRPDGPPLSEFLLSNPGFGAPYLDGSALVEAKGEGRTVFDVPGSDDGWNAVTLALYCADDSAYELNVLVDGVAVDATWAESCAADGAAALYTTAALPEGTVQVEVVVDQGTRFNLGVFGYSQL